ncbi:hypothetical protein [Asaia bogorensis]|uniref:Uncharacterized protein n=1 Tax=Asaia bogorensis NBRC 16594 TaxID=1231624 RepID=A0AAN4U387_9PROT|nr:hypothetical protein [Asaia bogorensis]GBQ77950.1 hypothetical protein AA0311_1615 [Asaia bogorensis NBRC 16594]GEL54464.1 hypothetical protein ABO01nite_24710 [Asaia bogorensis NBRC 16594]
MPIGCPEIYKYLNSNEDGKKVRLKNISAVLHKYIISGGDLVGLFGRIFSYCRKELNTRLESISFTDEVPKFISETEFPKKEDYKEISGYYDDKYFSCEDSGDQDMDSIYFSFSRFSSALDYFYRDFSVENIEEAIYEIIMSTENPKYTLKNIEYNLNSLIS